MNVISWLDGGKNREAPGNCNTRDVVALDCWDGGRHDAVEILKHHPDFPNVTQSVFEALEKEGITMFKPFG